MPSYTMVDELIDEWEISENKGTLPKDFWVEDKLKCPNGHGHMSKHYFAGSNIGVDQCQTCQGFWLDGGELKAVARDVKPNPQLDKAWQTAIRDAKELDKSIKELALLPATIAGYATYMKSMPIALALAVGLLLKFIVEKTIQADKELNSPNQ